MSIYKHNYRAYTGRLTPKWSRILVLARYGFAEIWSSKITIALFVLCLLPAFVSLVGIYLANNPLARMLVGANGPQTVSIDARFFLIVLQAHAWLALVLAAWIAPRLITFDLADNALPILLSHPISRFGYVAGKFVALFGCLSAVTWVPCLALFAYQSYSSPTPWAGQHRDDRGGAVCGRGAVGAVSFDIGARIIFVGEVENAGDGGDLRGHLLAGGNRRGGYRGASHALGLSAECALHDFGAMAANAGRSAKLAWPADGTPQRGHRFDAGPGAVDRGCDVKRTNSCAGSGARMNDRIVLEDVSKFYGEVLGVNRISLSLPPGITTLVGPNGSGKTTLMNLMTGLVQPSRGSLSVLGLKPGDGNEFFRNVGYCTQFDSFPRGLTGWQFVMDGLMLHGIHYEEAHRLAAESCEQGTAGRCGQPQDRRVQQGDAAEDPAGAGDRASSARVGSG